MKYYPLFRLLEACYARGYPAYFAVPPLPQVDPDEPDTDEPHVEIYQDDHGNSFTETGAPVLPLN